MKEITLYQQIALRQNVPFAGVGMPIGGSLHRGDVATVVDFVPHPDGGETGCLLEVFNALGDSVAVVSVPISAIEPLRADEVMSVRPLVSIGRNG